MRMLLEVLDDFLADHFTLKATQCGLYGLVRADRNKSHFVFSPPFGQGSAVKGKLVLNQFANAMATSTTPVHRRTVRSRGSGWYCRREGQCQKVAAINEEYLVSRFVYPHPHT